MPQLFPFTDPQAPIAQAPKTMVAGRGCHVTDAEGNDYLDAVAGLWCASLGFSETRLAAAAARQFDTLPYYHSFMGRTAMTTERLAARLADKLPLGVDRIFFACSGSEAVDTAVKLTRFYQNARGKTEKKRIVAREGAYHGSGIASAALTGMSYCHEGFDLPEATVLRTGRPHFHADAEPGETQAAFSRRRAGELDRLIRSAGPETVAAFIGEPVMGSGGVIPPPDGYWDAIQEVLHRHDVLLIADEIITGFGRTGPWFACERYNIRPSMMTLGKQLTGGYFPMSALAIDREIARTIAAHAHTLGTLGHGFTYGGHPVGAAVALEAIRIYEEMDLPAHVGALSARLENGLARVAAHPAVGDMRVVGLMAGVEFLDGSGTAAALARQVAGEAERRGVLFRIIGGILAISPPLSVSEAEVDHLVDVLHRSIETITDRRAA